MTRRQVTVYNGRLFILRDLEMTLSLFHVLQFLRGVVGGGLKCLRLLRDKLEIALPMQSYRHDKASGTGEVREFLSALEYGKTQFSPLMTSTRHVQYDL